MSEDYYELLGVDPNASEEEILRAYRRQAAVHHPDVSDDPDAERTFRQLNRAKSVLTDEARRRAYDRLGHERFVDRATGAGSPSEEGGGGPKATPDADRTPDDARAVWGWVRAPTGPIAGGAGRASRSSGRGSDPWSAVEVDLRSRFGRGRAGPTTRGEAAAATAERAERCPTCHGRGSFVHVIDSARGRHRRVEPCERCGGTGTIAA